MFIRTFVVELFKIPSGSMTPTLVGDYVAEVDYDGNGQDDLLVLTQDPPLRESAVYQVFLRQGEGWEYQGMQEIATADVVRLNAIRDNGGIDDLFRRVMHRNSPVVKRNDKIFVNKFAYWFSPPDRGDLVVFKVPRTIYDDLRPIYIKRAVAFGGEKVALVQTEECPEGKGRLAINGELVEQPPIFSQLCYGSRVNSESRPPENQYRYAPGGVRYLGTDVPEGSLLALGDNTDSSSDGRYWGTVPLENLKGKAFFRYSPLSKTGFLH